MGAQLLSGGVATLQVETVNNSQTMRTPSAIANLEKLRRSVNQQYLSKEHERPIANRQTLFTTTANLGQASTLQLPEPQETRCPSDPATTARSFPHTSVNSVDRRERPRTHEIEMPSQCHFLRQRQDQTSSPVLSTTQQESSHAAESTTRRLASLINRLERIIGSSTGVPHLATPLSRYRQPVSTISSYCTMNHPSISPAPTMDFSTSVRAFTYVASNQLLYTPRTPLTPHSTMDSSACRLIGDCSICFEELSADHSHGVTWCRAECRHIYHTKCIREWLTINYSCPTW